MQGKVALGEGVPQRRPEEEIIGRCVGIGGNKVHLREWARRPVSLRKGAVVTCRRCEEGSCMQKSYSGTPQHGRQGPHQWHQDRNPFTKGAPELQLHERVVEAHGCSGARVGRNMKTGGFPAWRQAVVLGSANQSVLGHMSVACHACIWLLDPLL
jgi:hypothetical protein